MAFGVIKLSKSQRAKLSCLVTGVITVIVTINVLIIGACIYVCVAIAPSLYSERAEINFVFVIIALNAMTTIITFALGIIVCQKCITHPAKKSTQNLLKVWSSFASYFSIVLLVVAALTRKIYKHIIRSMKHSFHIGMHNYLKDEAWKVAIDEMQYNMQCCGFLGYKDWHETQWLLPIHVNFDAVLVKKFEHAGHLLEVTPWSCCRIDFPMQCLHDPLQQLASVQMWSEHPNLIEDSINTNGCLEVLRYPIRTVLVVFIVLVVIQFLAQILLFLMVRILYTSSRNSTLVQGPNGVAPGWLFGRGDCGYNRGKTVYDYMADYNIDVPEKNALLSDKAEPLEH